MIKSSEGKNRNKKKQCHETYFLPFNTSHIFIEMKEFKTERFFENNRPYKWTRRLITSLDSM